MVNNQNGAGGDLNLGPDAVEKARKAAEILGAMPLPLAELLEGLPTPVVGVEDIRCGTDLFGHWPIRRGPLTRTERRALFCNRVYLPGEKPIPYMQLLIEFELTDGRGYSPNRPLPVIGGPDYHPE